MKKLIMFFLTLGSVAAFAQRPGTVGHRPVNGGVYHQGNSGAVYHGTPNGGNRGSRYGVNNGAVCRPNGGIVAYGGVRPAPVYYNTNACGCSGRHHRRSCTRVRYVRSSCSSRSSVFISGGFRVGR